MATRRLKFKPKPVVGLAVRRAKDGADTSTDTGNSMSDNNIEGSRGPTSDIHTPSSDPPSKNEIKGNSLAVEENSVVHLSSENSQQYVNSVVLHNQNKESTSNNNDLVLPSSKKSSQGINRSVLSSDVSANDNSQHVNVSCVLNSSFVSNDTAKNSKNVLNQTGVSDSYNNSHIISRDKSVILQTSSHTSELKNSEFNKNNDIILTNKIISSRTGDSLTSDYSLLNTNTDSDNTKLQLNFEFENGKSAEPQSSEVVKKNDLLLLSDKIVKIRDSVASPGVEGIVINGDIKASFNDSIVKNSNSTVPPNDKIVENKDNSTAKPSNNDSKFKALSRFKHPRCKPVVASNIARRKTEEINRVNSICNDNSNNNNNNKEINHKPQPSSLLKCEPILENDKVSENSAVHSDSVTLSETQTEQNFTCQRGEHSRTTNVSESVQSEKTDDLLHSQIGNDESSKKSQGTNIDVRSENLNVSEILLSSTGAAFADVNTLTDTVNNNSVLDGSTQISVTATTTTTATISATTTTELRPLKTFSKTKRNHRTHGSSYSKMGHDTMENFKKKFGSQLPDKTQLKMKDLIFYNPKSNPMLKTPRSKKPSCTMKPDSESIVEEIIEEQKVDDIEHEEQESSPAMPVPQLKIGPDGQIILDPKSLIIETTEMQRNRQNLENSEVILETEGKYGCYSKKRNTRHDWRPEETLQFYRALHTIGTDFSLMATLFPKRSRRDLKLKFKYEEKVNLSLIDKAITNPRQFDFEQLENDIKKENEERERIAAEELRVKEDIKKQKELLRQQKEEMRKVPRKSLALKEFNAEDTGEFRGMGRKKKKSKKPRSKRKREDESSGEECEQEMIFDYNRLNKMCSAEDRDKKETVKKRNAKRRKNTAKKSCTNKRIDRLSKNNDNDVDDSNGDNKDDVDIIGNILTTTRSGRKPKRSKKRIIEELLFTPKKYAKRDLLQNCGEKLKNSTLQTINKHGSNVKTNEVTALNTRTRSSEIDDHNNESNVSSLSADLEETFMNQVNGYNSEELTASVTRLTGRLEKRMSHISNLEKRTPSHSTNSLSSPLPSFSTLTPGIHNSRALSESMKIIDQLTSDVETACVEMSEDQLIEIINEAGLNQIENENIPVEDTTVAVLNTDTDGFNETNSIINVRNSSDCNDNQHNIMIIPLEFSQSNHNDDSNNNNSAKDSSDGVVGDNSVSLVVPHYEVITGDMLGEEVTYFGSDAGADIVINEQRGTEEDEEEEEETYLILEETTAEEEHSQQKDTNDQQKNPQQQQQQQHKNRVTDEGITHTEESECILGE